jgi:hypothetical protein
MNKDLKQIPQRLEGLSIEFKPETGEVIHRGTFKNLKITQYPTKLYIRGSLSVFLLGTNIKTLTCEETALGIECLKDELQLDMSGAWVSRLDFGTNLNLEHQLAAYTAFFGELPNYSKSAFGKGKNKTITFGTTRRQLRFYDKIREQKKHRLTIPDEFLGHNVCRYEISFLRPSEEFKVDRVTVKMLSVQKFFSKAVQKWSDLYFSIPKLQKLKMVSDLNIRTIHDLNRMGLTYLTQNQHLFSALMAKIDPNEIGKSQSSRLRTKLRMSSNNRSLTIPDTRITELDQKVREAARIYQS